MQPSKAKACRRLSLGHALSQAGARIQSGGLLNASLSTRHNQNSFLPPCLSNLGCLKSETDINQALSFESALLMPKLFSRGPLTRPVGPRVKMQCFWHLECFFQRSEQQQNRRRARVSPLPEAIIWWGKICG